MATRHWIPLANLKKRKLSRQATAELAALNEKPMPRMAMATSVARELVRSQAAEYVVLPTDLPELHDDRPIRHLRITPIGQNLLKQV